MTPAGPGQSAPPEPAVVMASAAKGMVQELCSAFEAAVSKPVKGGEVEVVTLDGGEIAARAGEAGAAFCLDFGGCLKGHAAIFLPGRVAAAMAGILKSVEGEALTAKIEAALENDDIEELGVTVAGALVGFTEKLSDAVGEAPGLGLGDSLLLPEGDFSELTGQIGPGPYPCAAFEIEVEELAKGTALVVFPGSFSGIVQEMQEQTDATVAADAIPAGGTLPERPGGDVISGLHPQIQRILRLKLPVSVLVAEKSVAMESVIKLSPGTIIEFSKSADEDLDLLVNDRKIASGEVVIIGERFGIQLRSIEGLQQRIRKLGTNSR